MADFAGALAAIRAKFVAEWIVGPDPRTRIALVNENPADPWPPKNPDNSLQNYVLLAPTGNGIGLCGFGTPGNQLTIYPGLIDIHVYAPVGKGTSDAFTLAVAAGEIFRNQLFYNNVTPGCYLRSWTPRVDGGGPGDDDGIWFRVSANIPFDYYHLG